MTELGFKNDEGKIRWDLLPYDALEQVANVLTHGTKEYPNRNWELGMSWMRVFGALGRHLSAWVLRRGNDPKSGLSHMAHVVCCALFLLTYELRGKGKDDRPDTTPYFRHLVGAVTMPFDEIGTKAFKNTLETLKKTSGFNPIQEFKESYERNNKAESAGTEETGSQPDADSSGTGDHEVAGEEDMESGYCKFCGDRHACLCPLACKSCGEWKAFQGGRCWTCLKSGR